MPWLQSALATIGFFLLSIFGGSHVPTVFEPQASTTTSVAINNGLYGIADSHVYYDGYFGFSQSQPGVMIPNADPSTFKVVSGSDGLLSKDATHVFYVERQPCALSTDPGCKSDLDPTDDDAVAIVPNPDPATFSAVTDAGNYSYFSKDKNSVYYEYTSSTGPYGALILKSVPGIDPASFHSLDTTQSSFLWPGLFYANNTNVYLAQQNEHTLATSIKAIPNADPTTFEFVPDSIGSSTEYVKDKNSVWYYDPIDADNNIGNPLGLSLLPNADPSSFVAFAQPGNPPGGIEYYAKDKNRVYYNRSIISGADPSTFVMLSGATADAQDKNNAYINGQPVFAGNVYVKNNSLYIDGAQVAGNIPASLGLSPSTFGQYYDSVGGFAQDFEDSSLSNSSDTVDTYTSVATSTDGSLAAFVYYRTSGSGDTSTTDSFASMLVYSSTGLADRYDLDLNTFDPDFIQILSVNSSKIMFDLSDGKCDNELYKLTIPDNQLTDLGVDPNTSEPDCAF